LGLFFGLGLQKIKTTVAIRNFFLDDDPVLIEQNAVEKLFGNNDFVGVLVEADDIFLPTVLKTIRELGAELKKEVPYSGEVTSITEIGFLPMDQVPLTMSESESYRATFDKLPNLKGRLYSNDYRQSWIILSLKSFEHTAEFQSEDPIFLVGRIAYDIIQKYKQEGIRLTPGGIPILDYREKVEMEADMLKILIIASIITFLFLLFAIRNFIPLLGALFVVGFTLCAIFGILGWVGEPVDITFVLIPITLTIAIAIEYTNHTYTYFKRGLLKAKTPSEALNYALREAGWPNLFSALTNIVALLSFIFVPIRIVKWIGVMSALSMIILYITATLFYTVFLTFTRIKPIPAASSEKILKKQLWFEHYIGKFGHFILRRRIPILISACVLIMLSFVGLSQLRVDLSMRKMMGVRLPHCADLIKIIESEVGTSYAYNLVLQFPEQTKLQGARLKDVLKKTAELKTRITKEPMVKRVTSIEDSLAMVHQVLQKNDPAFYYLPEEETKLQSLLRLYGRLAPRDKEQWLTGDATALRINVEISDYTSQRLKTHLERVNTDIKEIFAGDLTRGMIFLKSGMIIQLSAMNDYVANGLITSLGTALLSVIISMIIVFFSFRLGVIGLIPNLVPIIIAGGTMGFMGVNLDFINITIGTLVLGLAADNVIHFISHVQQKISLNTAMNEAIVDTFQKVGKSITQTALVLSITFSAFLFSEINMMNTMGLFSIIAILSALFANFTIAPILLSFFISKKGKQGAI
jgi:hypothetical protein